MDISRSSGCNLEGTEDDESTVLREGVSHLHLNGGKTEPVSAVEVAMDSGADLTEALKVSVFGWSFLVLFGLCSIDGVKRK